MRLVKYGILVGALLAATGCEEKTDEAVESAKAAAATAASAMAEVKEAAKDKAAKKKDEAEALAAALQTEEDFEIEIAETITSDNLESELDKLEKELEGE